MRQPFVTLRPVELADVTALQRVCWTEVSLLDVQFRVRSLVSPRENGRARGVVALVGGELVGFGQLTCWGLRGEICNLIVSQPWRNRGIGTAIIRGLIALAREQMLHDVEIGGAESNPRAIALYRRLGFRDERRVMVDLGSGLECVLYLTISLREAICE